MWLRANMLVHWYPLDSAKEKKKLNHHKCKLYTLATRLFSVAKYVSDDISDYLQQFFLSLEYFFQKLTRSVHQWKISSSSTSKDDRITWIIRSNIFVFSASKDLHWRSDLNTITAATDFSLSNPFSSVSSLINTSWFSCLCIEIVKMVHTSNTAA